MTPPSSGLWRVCPEHGVVAVPRLPHDCPNCIAQQRYRCPVCGTEYDDDQNDPTRFPLCGTGLRVRVCEPCYDEFQAWCREHFAEWAKEKGMTP